MLRYLHQNGSFILTTREGNRNRLHDSFYNVTAEYYYLFNAIRFHMSTVINASMECFDGNFFRLEFINNFLVLRGRLDPLLGIRLLLFYIQLLSHLV